MTFEIEVNGRARLVGVERVAGSATQYRVTVDGRPQTVDAALGESDTVSLLLPAEGGRSHEVGFAEGPLPGELFVHFGTATLVASVNAPRARRAQGHGGRAGLQRVLSPMPGRVLRILVSEGEAVAARQPLVVVEAMKMENELSCAQPGIVKEVTVGLGQSVEAGRLLVVVE